MSVELCSAGWRVAMVDMDSVRLREATEQVNLIASKVLHGCLPEATAHLMDVRDASAWTSLSNWVTETFVTKIDIGISP